jgi:hypothetical protein
MPFTVKFRDPRYSGKTDLVLRLFAKGGATRINGDADDPFTETGSSGLFAATVTESITGDFEFVVYRGATAIQIGFASRVADQATVILGEPVESSSSNASTLATAIAARLSTIAMRRLDSAAQLNTDHTVVRGTTWRIPLAVDDIPDDWTRIEFTARADSSQAQIDSLLHVIVSNPSDEEADGLQVLRGAAVVPADRDNAAIEVEDLRPICVVDADAVADVADGEYCWDCKVTSADGTDQINRGTLFVELDVTRLVV